MLYVVVVFGLECSKQCQDAALCIHREYELRLAAFRIPPRIRTEVGAARVDGEANANATSPPRKAQSPHTWHYTFQCLG